MSFPSFVALFLMPFVCFCLSHITITGISHYVPNLLLKVLFNVKVKKNRRLAAIVMITYDI